MDYKRNRKNPKIERPIKLDREEYKGKRSVERLFSWIEAHKKVYPRHERLEKSYLGLVLLAGCIMLWRDAMERCYGEFRDEFLKSNAFDLKSLKFLYDLYTSRNVLIIC